LDFEQAVCNRAFWAERCKSACLGPGSRLAPILASVPGSPGAHALELVVWKQTVERGP
jgi:hypothetical protein